MQQPTCTCVPPMHQGVQSYMHVQYSMYIKVYNLMHVQYSMYVKVYNLMHVQYSMYVKVYNLTCMYSTVCTSRCTILCMYSTVCTSRCTILCMYSTVYTLRCTNSHVRHSITLCTSRFTILCMYIVCPVHTDGSLYIVTAVDPLFLVLPYLMKATEVGGPCVTLYMYTYVYIMYKPLLYTCNNTLYSTCSTAVDQ